MNQINYLDAIVMRKKNEFNRQLNDMTASHKQYYQAMLSQKNTSTQKFSAAIKKTRLAVIGEIKRKSPSRGLIGTINDPAELALKYCRGGATAISVLTDYEGFGGSITDLQQVASNIANQYPEVAVLRKDFIVHPMQLVESLLAGASAVLLIARTLGKELPHYINSAKNIGLETLTETHDEDDIKLALDSGAEIIGVNHRNLQTFTIDINLSETLRPLIPNHIITVAESGIHTAENASRMRQLGYDAILVGEALVSSPDPQKLIAAMQGVTYEG